jgi:precorrin-8X/cobalt-precorrin-8 methylmutase
MPLIPHPILHQSFKIIDQEIGPHDFSADQYQILQRVIHATADFEFKDLIYFSPGVIPVAIAALEAGSAIITDVSMVKQGILSQVQQTFGNPLISAVEQAEIALPGKTRTETGLLWCFERFPEAIYVIGNAPTALLSLCESIATSDLKPACVIAAPVGFVSVVESKAALAGLNIPQIRIEGRKGGSPAAAAMVNALLALAWQRQPRP